MTQNPGLYKSIRIKKIKEEVKGFKTFVFEENHNIKYIAGQYLTLVTQKGEQEIRRSYSFTSAPVLKEPLTIGVKRIQQGYFSQLLVDHARPHDELITTGSGGLFVLPENMQTYQQIFFFAAGIGITPIYSLLKTALHHFSHLSIVLVYSNNSPATTIFSEELRHLKFEYTDRFHLEFLFSNAPDLSTARLHRELLIRLLNRFSIADHAPTLFYTCGPHPYMRMCIYVLQQLHVPSDNIKKENFLLDQVRPPELMPPDKETHKAIIRYGANEYQVPVHYPDSILHAAKKQGIMLPYSCETGRCGNCLARRINGQVWLSYNEVLTDKELSQGLTLTCVGHPVGGDVELEINEFY